MIRISRSGAIFSGSSEDLERFRRQFDRQHFLRFPEFLEPGLLRSIQPLIHRGEFEERVHEGIGTNKELWMRNNPALAALVLLMNRDALFRIIQDITQCDRIRCFEGRVYRFIPGHRHHDSWHDDLVEHRLVAMSINLSKEVYTGGVLQLRDRESGQIVTEVTNVGIGDAVLFRLSSRLQHRITEVEGRAAKTAFAGWFRAQPDFLSLLRQQSEPE